MQNTGKRVTKDFQIKIRFMYQERERKTTTKDKQIQWQKKRPISQDNTTGARPILAAYQF